MKETKVTAEALRQFCAACFEKLGLPATDAQVTAENLIFANLRGVDSHGVIRLKIYTERLRAGGFRTGTTPQILSESESTALLDAGHGVGQVAGVAAMNLAIAKARRIGSGWVSVRNSNHFGAAAFYALKAAAQGMIGFAATNAGPTMAPSGGRQARLGNNAFAVAIPVGQSPPLVLDMATGAVAWGKIFVAQQEKKKIPATWALDKDGVPTDDPDAAAQGGFIQPLGGYKGYGLSLLLDVLTGVLSGGGFATQVRTLYQDLANPSQVAHTCAALRVDVFMQEADFCQRMQSMIDSMHACPVAAGCERIYVPGEIEHQTERQRMAEGIPINPALRAELTALAAELAVSSPFQSALFA
jgi:LDH2 family malate/lactate/ureidoglycolate dehydrogenase